ncbi:MAG: hypothetical protein PF689_03975 [Deltaproteobacteria bacterium]|jgi:hypothetical protein|nr:hypothetical protein [Deltaproteobacteria bacterium]
MRYKRLSFILFLFTSTFFLVLACSKTEKSEDEAQVASNFENKKKTIKEQEPEKKYNSKSSKKLNEIKAKKELKNNEIANNAKAEAAKTASSKNDNNRDSRSRKTSNNNSSEVKSDQAHRKINKKSKNKPAEEVLHKNENKQKNPESESELKILDPGKGKKVALRYKYLSFKNTEYLKMEMITKVGLEIEGRTRPPRQAPVIVMIMKIEHQQKSKNQLTYKFSLDKVQVKKTASVSEEENKKTVAILKKNMKNLEGIAKVNSQGKVDKIWFSKDFVYDANLNQVMNNVKNQLKNMVVPLPKNKVGVGAKWKAVRKTKMQGLDLTTEYEYTLSKLNNNSAVLDVKIFQKAPKQKIQNKKMPPQFEVFLEKLVSNGKGTLEIKFNSLVPKSRIELKMALNSLVKGGARKMKMVMKLGIKVLISPFKN